jgi:hypothetical protein
MTPFAVGGIVAWALAGAALWIFGAPASWLWICVAGFLMGFPGLVVMRAHDRRRAAQPASDDPGRIETV